MDKKNTLSSEDSVPLKQLPKNLQMLYSIETIRSKEVPLDEKVNLVKVYGKNSKEWAMPRSARAREFAIDMILHQLNEASTLKVGTYINLPEKAIKWIIKEA